MWTMQEWMALLYQKLLPFLGLSSHDWTPSRMAKSPQPWVPQVQEPPVFNLYHHQPFPVEAPWCQQVRAPRLKL